MPPWLSHHEEVRLDIDASVNPDIVASMTDMGDIGPFDAVYCSHALEHLYPHDVSLALGEFRRVLGVGGRAIVIVPDLEDIRPTEDVVFVAPAGPITGLDMIFGFRAKLKEMPHMAHHTGFVAGTLKAAFEGAGFTYTVVKRLADFNLLAVVHESREGRGRARGRTCQRSRRG